MSSTFGGSRSSAEPPVVCLLVGAPGFDPGRPQQSAAPVYKTEPHASADAVQRMREVLLIAENGRNVWI
jgi:hypothetical protein